MHADPERQMIDQYALDRYLAGESGAEECAAVDAWLAAHPEQAARLQRSVGLSRQRMEGDWARIVARIGESIPAAQADVSEGGRRREMPGGWFAGRSRSRWSWVTPFAVAATVALLVVGGRRVISGAVTPTHPAFTTYATNAGERANITLSDGSHVTLNVASQLQVPTDFAHGDRTLRLVGEALFSVAHRSGTPFVVVSGATATRVLGTSFLVRHYAADTTTVVAVRDGKVVVRSSILTAGKQLMIDRAGRARVQNADAEQFAFAAGVLVLRYMSLAEAIPELNRWYNADIRLGDPALASRGIRGRFLAGSSADLAAILGFDVRVVRDGRVLTLFPRR